MLQQIYPQVEHDFKFELNKDFQFAAAHFVPHESAGMCQNMHGHTYFCNLTIVGNTLDDAGFLIDFKALKDLVHKRFDHKVLNDDVAAPVMPSTEAMSEMIHKIVSEHLGTLPNRPWCIQVFLRETPTSYVIYRPSTVGCKYGDS